MLSIHLEILDKKRAIVFQQLKEFREYGYLAGGTALALQINHRRSYDFDVFIHQTVNHLLKHKIAKVFGNINYYVEADVQVSFRTNDGIAVTFVQYEFALVNKPIATKSLSLASIVDIAADKAYTLGRRAVWRDYIDLFFIIRKQILDLQTIIASAQKKIAGEFNEIQFLEQLTYFDDIKIVPIDFIGKSYPPNEIKQFLESAVKTYLAKRK